MEETRFYTCQHCFENFIPKRRRVQKFCSTSCRSSSWQLNRKTDHNKETLFEEEKSEAISNDLPKEMKIEKMSVEGIGNSFVGGALGSGLVRFIEIAATKDKNKPLTKGDMLKMLQALNEKTYYPIKNLDRSDIGFYPHFNIKNQEVVYLPYIIE